MKRFFFLVFLIGLIFQISAVAQQKTGIFTIGDSTVKNGQGNGAGGLWGWGDPFVCFFDTTRVTVENCAMGGTSSRTYQTKGLWSAVHSRLKPGDFVLMQFGHNDGGALNDTSRARGTIKGIGEEAVEIDNLMTKLHEVVHSFGWYLRKMIRETKEKGAIPVVITPIPRNDWENGKIRRTPDSYPQWAMEVAKQEKVLCIDLNRALSDKLDLFGEQRVTGKFYGSNDHTHTLSEGAVLSASLVVAGLKAAPESGLAKFLLKDPVITFPVKKRVFVIGDSTVANGNDSIVGWGRELPAFFDTSRVAIVNKARGGRSSRTFLNEGLWAEILPQIRKGDFVLMQFGHNDGARPDAEKFRGSLRGTGGETMLVTKPDGTKETVQTYGWYMKKYIRDTREKGAVPIVFSQIPRNEWPEGRVERVSQSYGKWAKEAAGQADAFFVDLNELVAAKYEEIGKPMVKAFFPGDHTHTNKAGAILNALTVAEGIKALKKCELAAYLVLPVRKTAGLEQTENTDSQSVNNSKLPISDLGTLRREFKQPAASYGPSILWGWEGPVTKEVIVHDLDQFKRMNIRSVNIEAGYGLASPYLSEGYFDLIKFAVEQAKIRGMVIWMIDESKYPSGFAGGKFSRERPDLRMQGLDVLKKIDLSEGQSYNEVVSTNVLSAVGVNKESGESRMISLKEGKLQWTAPKGTWQILVVRHKFRTSVTRAGNNPTHGKDTLNSLCDYLNPAATRQFIEFTHEQYKKHLSDEFGKTFLGFRGDEPDYGFVPWTPALPDEFLKKKGYDVRPWVASFLIKNPTDSMLRVKADYWDVWSDMFGENFFKVQADWCAANNLKYMVHLNHEDKMMALAQSGGDFFKDLRNVQVPGIDAIWNQVWPGTVADFPKYASSVAHVYGHQQAMSESFAAYKTPPTVDQAKWVTDHQLVRGINLFEWMYWPASTSGDGSPKGWFGDPNFPKVAQYTNRVSYLLSGGHPTADLAVYYPTDSEWLGYQKADSSTLALCKMLLENQRDFDFVDNYAISSVLEAKGNGLQNRSGQLYRTILIPAVASMSKTTLDKLKKFVVSGGKVIFTASKPSIIVGHSFRSAGKAYNFDGFIFETPDRIFRHLPEPDLKLGRNNAQIKYNHRKFPDGDLYFVFNEGDTAFESDVTISGNGKAQLWDAFSGEIAEMESVQKNSYIQLHLNIPSWETKIIVIPSGAK
jgi:lysophospholipase L1-like esterase